MKLLSVIIPSYNMEQYLPKCLDSLIVAPELIEKVEVLVVNDGSKDRTNEIAHEYVAKWPGTFNVIDKANGHYGSCINAALPRAKGLYVKVLDADDWFDKEVFARYVEVLAELHRRKAAEVPDLVLTDYDKVDMDGDVLIRFRQPFEEGEVPVQMFFDKAATEDYYPAMHGVTYRIKMLLDADYRQSEGVPYTDGEWILYPMANVRKVWCCHLNLYRYLLGREGQTMSQSFRAEAGRLIKTVIQRRLVAEYDKCMRLDFPPFRDYFRKMVLDIFSDFYGKAVLGRGTVEFDGGLSGFEAFVQTTAPDLFALLDDVRITRLFSFRLIHAWRGCAFTKIALFSVWAKTYNAFLFWRHDVKVRCKKLCLHVMRDVIKYYHENDCRKCE